MTVTTERDRNNENDAHNLLPPSLEKTIPRLYATENIKEEEKIVYAKFFTSNTGWTWFALEGEWDEEHEDFTFFGLVHGLEKEYGYFSLNELKSVTDPRFRVERELFFEPTPLKNFINDR
jgi:hypothetical protein